MSACYTSFNHLTLRIFFFKTYVLTDLLSLGGVYFLNIVCR